MTSRIPRVRGSARRCSFFNEKRHGVAATGHLVYKAEGLTEPEGEFEALASFRRTLGPVHGLLNVAYGQDADAKERDGAVALHISTALPGHVIAGLLGRYRDALGSGGDARTGIIRDVFAGLSATVVVGPIGLTGMAGISGVQTQTASMKSGPPATLAIGTGFRFVTVCDRSLSEPS